MTKLVYILAASHSGSTLLTMLLNSHPDIATVGELAPGHMEDTDRYLCSCGRRIKECDFWQAIETGARNAGLPFSVEEFGTRFCMPESPLATRLLKPLHRGPALERIRDMALRMLTGWPKRFKQICCANEVLAEQILRYYGASTFLDKGNRALRLKFLLRAGFDVKVIHLVRDGRAVALTYVDPARYADATDPALRGGGTGGDRADERCSMTKAAYDWRRCVEEAEHVLATVDPDRQISVRYEDVCTNTDAALNGILEFLSLDPAARVSNFRSVEHHVVGNGMRLNSTSEIRLDERWRTVLTEEQLEAFNRVAGDLSRKYGYE